MAADANRWHVRYLFATHGAEPVGVLPLCRPRTPSMRDRSYDVRAVERDRRLPTRLFRSQVAAVLTAGAIYLGRGRRRPGRVQPDPSRLPTHMGACGAGHRPGHRILGDDHSGAGVRPRPRSGPACWSWSGTRWCWVRWHATHVPPRHL